MATTCEPLWPADDRRRVPSAFLVTLSWTNNDVPYTIGQALDKLPAVAFLHVFLAFPSGRLSGRFEQILVAAAFVTAIVLELVGW